MAEYFSMAVDDQMMSFFNNIIYRTSKRNFKLHLRRYRFRKL